MIMKTYIEKEALLAFPIRINHYDKENGNLDFVLGIESVMEYAEYLPVADVMPVKHGRWVSLTECANEGVYCSVCYKKVYKADYALCNKKNKVRSPYCPNCGAKMDLEEYNG